MFDKTKVKSMTKKKLNESEYSKLDSDIEKSILESIENDSDDFNFDDEADDATIDEAEGATDGDVITEDADFDISADDTITEAEGATDGDTITEDEDVPMDDMIIEEEIPSAEGDDLPIDLPEAEGDDDFEIVDDITEEEIPAPADDEDFDLSDEDFADDNAPIEEMTNDDQDPEMILDAEEVPSTDPDLDFDLDASMDEEADSEEKILEDLQAIEARKMKLESAKAEMDGTDKNDLITEVKKHKAALRKLASKYVDLKEAYNKVVTNKKQLTESAQKSVKANASLKLENFKAVKALAIFANADLKPATKMRIIEGFDACKDEKSATALYNTVVRKIKESAKSDQKLNQIVQGKKGVQKVVKESVQPKADTRNIEEMRNDYLMGIDDAYESQFYKRYAE